MDADVGINAEASFNITDTGDDDTIRQIFDLSADGTLALLDDLHVDANQPVLRYSVSVELHNAFLYRVSSVATLE